MDLFNQFPYDNYADKKLLFFVPTDSKKIGIFLTSHYRFNTSRLETAKKRTSEKSLL